MSELIPQISPYAKSGISKQPTFANLNYTNQDFWSLKNRLVQLIKERFGASGTVMPNTFNDLVESSIAIMLIENWAFIGDMLSFKIDQIANEIFIDTVTEIDNAFRICKLVGFEPLPPIAARTMWTGSINNSLNVDLRIPTPISIDAVSGDTPITIELFQADSNNEPMFDTEIVIPAGSFMTQSVIGLEGVTRQSIFTGTGEISQTYSTPNNPVIFDSVRVFVNGTEWEKVDFFTDSQPRKEFRVEFDSGYHAYVIFGNNRAGVIPPSGSVITVNYRQGGGTVGNIVTGSLTRQTAVPVVGIPYAVPVSWQNYTKGEYGYDGDTLEDIRTKLPKWITAQNRAVTGDDYKILADQFATAYHGSVGKSLAVLRNHGCAANIIDLYILAKAEDDMLEQASNELKVDLSMEFNDKKMLTDHVCIKDGEVVSVDINIEVTLDKFYNKFENEIKQKITAITKSFFSLNMWEYGQNLKDSDLIKSLSSIKEVTNYTINFTTSDPNNSGALVTTKFYQIIRPESTAVWMNYE